MPQKETKEKIKIEDLLEYDGNWHKKGEGNNCEPFTMADLKELISQEKQKAYNKGLDTKFSDIDFKGTREAIRKEAIKEEKQKWVEEERKEVEKLLKDIIAFLKTGKKVKEIEVAIKKIETAPNN